MPKPRSLGGGGRKAEALGHLRGLNKAGQAIDAPISPDSGDMRSAPIDEVRPDPNNPRRLGITWEIVQQDPETIEDARIRKEVEEIQGLATTIRRVGQRSPCEVVREGSIFRIIFGERRYWASRLAGLPTLKVIVLHATPENVPLVQLIENIQHRHLPIYETILNLRSVIEREAELGEPLKDATDLIQRTGLSRPSAYRYWKYMDIPKDVEEVLANRVISTHDDLNALLKNTTEKARKEAVARFFAGGSLSVIPASPPSKKQSRATGGRPRTSICFGSTKNPSVAKFIFAALDPNGEFETLEWNDPTAVTNAWKTILKNLEARAAEDG